MDGRFRPVPEADCGGHRGTLGDARRSSRLSQGIFGEGRELISNLVLGANCDNHDSVHGSRKSLGAEHWVGKAFEVCTLRSRVQPMPAEAG
jgi:hypothetical protein